MSTTPEPRQRDMLDDLGNSLWGMVTGTANYIAAAPVMALWIAGLVYLSAPWEGLGGIVSRVLGAILALTVLGVGLWVVSIPRFMRWLRVLLPGLDAMRARHTSPRQLDQHRVKLPRVKDRETRRLMRVVVKDWGVGCVESNLGQLVMDRRGRELIQCPIIEDVSEVPAGFELVVRPTAGLSVDQVVAAGPALESVFSCRVRVDRYPSASVPLVKIVFLMRDVLAETVMLDLDAPVEQVPW